MLKVRNSQYKFGFLDFDMQDFVFVDSDGVERQCGNLHVSVSNHGIRVTKDKNWNKECLFPHPHVELYGHMEIHRQELQSLFEHSKKEMSQSKKKNIKLPPLPIQQLLDENKFDEIINLVVEDLSVFDNNIVFTSFHRFPEK